MHRPARVHGARGGWRAEDPRTAAARRPLPPSIETRRDELIGFLDRRADGMAAGAGVRAPGGAASIGL